MALKDIIQAKRQEKFGRGRRAVAAAALEANVSQSYWEKLEAGQMANPSLAIVGRIASALDMPVSDLLELPVTTQ